MRKVLSAAVVVVSALIGSAAFACGGPPPTHSSTSAGYSGTTVGETGNSISVFSGSATGYSWDRIQLPSTTRNHIADITGTLSGSIETDVRVNTAITAQSGSVVEIGANGTTAINSGQTVVFGAALSSGLLWQVLTYDSTAGTLTLFSETAPGVFAQVSTVSANCGSATMLDAVVEPGGSLVSLCNGLAVETTAGNLTLTKLPSPGLAMARASDGTAVAYGTGLNGTDLVVMSHGATGWTSTSTIPASDAPTSVLAINEGSAVVQTSTGFTAYTLNGQTWAASSPLAALTPVTSATGAPNSPAQVLSGTYELTLNATDGTAGGTWTSTDLGPIGVAPVVTEVPDATDPGASEGCSSGAGSSGTALLALGLLALARYSSRRRA